MLVVFEHNELPLDERRLAAERLPRSEKAPHVIEYLVDVATDTVLFIRCLAHTVERHGDVLEAGLNDVLGIDRDGPVEIRAHICGDIVPGRVVDDGKYILVQEWLAVIVQ